MAEETQQEVNPETGEPAWYAEALDLKAQGVDDNAIGEAVGKSPSTIRKLIKRKTESGEFVPASSGVTGGVQETTVVDAGTAKRLQDAAGDSSGGEDPGPELFPEGTVEGDGLSLKNLIKPGQDVTMTIALMSHEIDAPKDGGLIDPDRKVFLLVEGVVAKPIPVPQRDSDKDALKVTGWKVRQQVRPVAINRVKGESVDLQAAFRAILEQDQAKAGALLDALNAAYREALSR